MKAMAKLRPTSDRNLSLCNVLAEPEVLCILEHVVCIELSTYSVVFTRIEAAPKKYFLIVVAGSVVNQQQRRYCNLQ